MSLHTKSEKYLDEIFYDSMQTLIVRMPYLSAHQIAFCGPRKHCVSTLVKFTVTPNARPITKGHFRLGYGGAVTECIDVNSAESAAGGYSVHSRLEELDEVCTR